MWKFKDSAEGNSKSENIQITKEKLLQLKPLISHIDSIEVGVNINASEAAFDLVLTSTHKDKKSLTGYIGHPAHMEAARFIGQVVADRKVVDYEY